MQITTYCCLCYCQSRRHGRGVLFDVTTRQLKKKMSEEIKECSYVLSNHIELDSVSKVRSLVLMPSFGIMRVQQHWIKRQILTHL